MKSIAISGSPRENVGKRDAKELRYQGLVPAVLYGGKNQIHFSVSAADLKALVYTPDVSFVALEIGSVKAQAIIQDVNFHPLTDLPLHVDFLELSDSKKVRVKLPVRLTGSARGVLAGGKLMTVFRNLQCVGLPGDLPDSITLDIAKLKIGMSIRVKNIEIPGVTILDPANAVVVSVKMARGAVKGADADDDDDEA